MLNFTIRNWKLFYRDRAAVFFSLMGPIIIVALYLFFLKNTLDSEMPLTDTLKSYLTDTWVTSGLVASTAVTTCLVGYNNLIKDRESGVSKDFQTSPVSRLTLVGGYMLNSLLIGLVMSVLTLALMQVYIAFNSGYTLGWLLQLQVMGIVLASVFSAAGLMALLSTLVPTQSAFSGANTVIGASIGFLVGAYIPLGALPEGVRSFVTFIPAAHSARALREVLMDEPLRLSAETAPGDFTETFKELLGVDYQLGDHVFTMTESITILLVSGLIGFILALVLLARKK